MVENGDGTEKSIISKKTKNMLVIKKNCNPNIMKKNKHKRAIVGNRSIQIRK